MKSSDKPEPEFLVGCRAVNAYINRLLAPAKLSEDTVYRLTDKRRKRPLPTGKVCRQLIASPTKIREFFEKLADGGDAGKANGDDPAGEMTTDGVVELSRGRRRPDR